jgi:hypothetical protein
MTTDGALYASQLPEAVYDSSSQQFFIRLQCGVFRFTQNPPFDVEWVVSIFILYIFIVRISIKYALVPASPSNHLDV